jgi:hypothetical protein
MALEVYGGQTVTQIGRLRLYHRADLDAQALLEAIEGGGDALKVSAKSETRRVGEWAVKRSRPEHGLGPLKRTLARSRYRRAWIAANYLHARGVRVPEPLAYGEWTSFGIVLGNVMVTRFLAGHVNVETYAAQMVREAATEEGLDAFFAGLASAVNRLADAGAYHADLSGKNIFTKDGREFYFIDLDGVVLGKRYGDALRLKNHIQLYDSFCDFCRHDLLARFIAGMLPDSNRFNTWMQAVEHGQKIRRRQHRDSQQR